MASNPTFNGIFSFFWDIAKVIILSLIIIVPIRYFIMQPFFVRGASMEPTYEQGDYLLVDEISYRFSEPERGDVIIFKFPADPSQFYIKRIIGLPGDTIFLSNEKVRIVNEEFPLGFVLEESYLTRFSLNQLDIELSDNEYFVLGDNRPSSSDSRKWGALPSSLIVGKVFLRAWPFNKFGFITTPQY